VNGTKPSVCRMVHYVSYGTPGGEYHSTCRAAVITEVGQWITVRTVEEIPGEQRTEACALMVCNPTGVFFNGAAGVVCAHDELPPPGKIVFGERATYLPGTWHWPERL
jgi:hypothetical protein